MSTKAGTIHADGTEIHVVLRDITPDGAKLRLLKATKIPETFRLVAPIEKLDTECILVTSEGRDCTVKFQSN